MGLTIFSRIFLTLNMNKGIFHIILSVPQNIVMDLNNVMPQTVRYSYYLSSGSQTWLLFFYHVFVGHVVVDSIVEALGLLLLNRIDTRPNSV